MRRITAEDILTSLDPVRHPAKKYVITPEVRVYPFTPPFFLSCRRIKGGERRGEVAGFCEVVDSKKRVVAAVLSEMEAGFITSALNHYTETP